MWKLAACDIWRDGGSYSATLVQSSRTLSLWLQVAAWDRPQDRTYEALFVSDGADPTVKQRLVPDGEPEHQWLYVLEHEVERNSVDPGSVARFE